MSVHLALVGPTASGKTELALDVARALGDVEIVSVDSMHVYRGLDVGTAKATPAERREVAHHLIDVADPHETWSVARFQAAARDAIADIEHRGRRALLVGGTGLYVRAALDGLTFPGEDLAVRAEIEEELGARGAPALHAELARIDPAAAARIEPGNGRRIVRALEVARVTGRPFSSFGPGVHDAAPVVRARIAGLWLGRDALRERIAARVERMRDGGLVDEVRRLAEAGNLSRSARQAIGYKEVLAYLDGTIPTLPAAFDEIGRRTRAFARRQRMWFRRDARIVWFASGANPHPLAPALLATWGR